MLHTISHISNFVEVTVLTSKVLRGFVPGYLKDHHHLYELSQHFKYGIKGYIHLTVSKIHHRGREVFSA